MHEAANASGAAGAMLHQEESRNHPNVSGHLTDEATGAWVGGAGVQVQWTLLTYEASQWPIRTFGRTQIHLGSFAGSAEKQWQLLGGVDLGLVCSKFHLTHGSICLGFSSGMKCCGARPSYH